MERTWALQPNKLGFEFCLHQLLNRGEARLYSCQVLVVYNKDLLLTHITCFIELAMSLLHGFFIPETKIKTQPESCY